ncbi:MAG: ParA family protein [Acidimicrobiales bacterium]
MRVLAVTGLKGGVGKTSTSVNLAALAASEGSRVILWDLDPQGAATYCLNLKQKLKGGATEAVPRQPRRARQRGPPPPTSSTWRSCPPMRRSARSTRCCGHRPSPPSSCADSSPGPRRTPTWWSSTARPA